MFCALIGELLALPELWLLARHKEGEILIMNNSDASTAPNGRASWGAALVAALPLVSFPAALLLERTMHRVLGTVRLGFLFRLLWADALQGGVMPMILYLLLVGGLLFAWLKGFPRSGCWTTHTFGEFGVLSWSHCCSPFCCAHRASLCALCGVTGGEIGRYPALQC